MASGGGRLFGKCEIRDAGWGEASDLPLQLFGGPLGFAVAGRGKAPVATWAFMP
jgi:hypothetical protein